MRRWTVVPSLAFGLSLAAAIPVRGTESLWNMEALGRWTYGYGLAARGAGSTAVGVVDPYATSFVNPAGIGWADLPQAYFGATHESRWIRSSDDESSDRRGSTALSGVRVVIPGPGSLRWGIGYRDLTSGRYQVRIDANPGRPDAYERTLEGKGGLGELSGAVAARVLQNRLALGVHVGVVNGTLQDRQEDDFVDGAFRDSEFLLRTRAESGWSWGVGVLGRPSPVVSIGASTYGRSSLDLKSIWTSDTAEGIERKAKFEVPAGYNLGLAVFLGRRHRIAADWNMKTWSKSELTVEPVGTDDLGERSFNLEDGHRAGIGYTLLPSPDVRPQDPLIRRSQWRLGVSWERLGIRQSDGASVEEWILSGGVGLPIQIDRGFVDLLLEFGRTGDRDNVGLEERFFRFGVGIVFGRFESRF